MQSLSWYTSHSSQHFFKFLESLEKFDFLLESQYYDLLRNTEDQHQIKL